MPPEPTANDTFEELVPLLDLPATADAAAEARLAESLNRLELLTEQLELHEEAADALAAEWAGDPAPLRAPVTAAPYPVDPLGFELPVGFQLSIVMPVYNEKRTIREIVARVRALPLPKEILLVDDGSTDGTRDILNELAELPEVRVILQPENRGKGAALRAGFEAARGEVIAVQDADLEYDPRDLPQLVRPIVEDQADVVYGSRFLEGARQDPSWLHRFGNGLLTWASNASTGLRLTDMETCYKVFRREVIQGVPLRQDRFGFEPEVTAKLARRGVRLCELPIRYQPRHWEEGKKIGLRDAFNAFYCIARYAWRD